MNLTQTIITIATAGVVSAFSEGICDKLNKQDYSQFVRVGGYTVAASTVITSIIKFFKDLKQI